MHFIRLSREKTILQNSESRVRYVSEIDVCTPSRLTDKLSRPGSDQSGGPAPLLPEGKKKHQSLKETAKRYVALCYRYAPWRSFCGLKSLSKIMTISAAVRLSPSPPALVLKSITKRSQAGRLKRSTACKREEDDVVPSSRS